MPVTQQKYRPLTRSWVRGGGSCCFQPVFIMVLMEIWDHSLADDDFIALILWSNYEDKLLENILARRFIAVHWKTQLPNIWPGFVE